MNCREAESLIFAARDGALDETRRAALAVHVAQCRACHEIQSELATAATSWRSADASAKVPAIEVEWHAIRRRIRGESQTAPVAGVARWWRPVFLGVGAAAALAFGAMLAPRWLGQEPDAENYVSYVVVHNTSDDTMVYEDAESGWLVVWVPNETAGSGI
jgi:anti-sigma factor RsiW